MSKNTPKATLAGLAAVLLWSSTVGFARSLGEQLGPLTTAASVFSLGGLLGITINTLLAKPAKVRAENKSHLFIRGLLFAVYGLTLYASLGLASNRSQVLELGLINYLWPILTVVLSLSILKLKAQRVIWLGFAVAFTGLVFVIGSSNGLTVSGFLANAKDAPLAYSLAFLAAFSWALYSTLNRLWATEKTPVFRFMLMTGLSIALLRLVFQEESSWSTGVIVELFLLTTAATCAYYCWDLGMRKGNFSLITSFAYFTPLFATVFAAIYLRAALNQGLLLGCLCLILAAVISRQALQEP